MKKILFLLTFSSNFSVFSQNVIIEKDLMVYRPTNFSIKLNRAYTENMFFGLFGVKTLVNALNTNQSNIKTLTITNSSSKKVVYKAIYDTSGNTLSIELSDELVTPTKVDYTYKNDLIEKETINKKGTTERVNYFFYEENKMYVKNANKLFDIVWLQDDILLKKSYLNQKLSIEDVLMHNCRITKSLGKDINKICFSNTTFGIPLKINEFMPSVVSKTENINLVEGTSSEIRLDSTDKYQILKNNQPRFEIILDQNKRIKEFKFLGNKSDKQQSMNFYFTYTFYK